jgi:hypothetical protein
MSNLQRFDQDGIEIVINTGTGESFASIRGYARMAGKDESTIRYRLKKSAGKWDCKTAEIQTVRGLQGAVLVPEEFIAEWMPKDNKAMATQLMKLGVRLFLHKMAGYKYQPATPELPQSYVEALKALVEAEEKKLLLEAENQQLLEENQELAEAVDDVFGYSSLIRIAKFNNVSEKSFSWRKLKAASIQLGLEIKTVPCPRFETKKLYPHDAWRLVYPDVQLPETTTRRIYLPTQSH